MALCTSFIVTSVAPENVSLVDTSDKHSVSENHSASVSKAERRARVENRESGKDKATVDENKREKQRKQDRERKEANQQENRVTWKDNPHDCDLDTQYVRKDNLRCIDKPEQNEDRSAARTAAEPTQQAEPEPVAQTSGQGCERWRELVSQYSWNTEVVLAIMEAESGCNPKAVNPRDNHGQCTGSYGLMQLACFHTGNPTNPAENIRVAHRIWQEQGFGPWGAYTSGAYQRYLN